MALVGFDVGGTNMRVASVASDGIGEVFKIPTPIEPLEAVQKLTALIRKSARDTLEAVAGGFPGVVGKDALYRAPNLPHWANFGFEEELRATLGTPVEIRNDADLAGLGEAVYGAGRDASIVAYFGIGTGVGTARIVNGNIDSGAYDFEAGHQIVDARTCASLESLVSGGAFQKRFGVHPKDAPRAGYEEMTPILASGIYNAILHWSPVRVVLGGSMMNEDNGYRLNDIKTALDRLPRIYPELPEIQIAHFKDEAGLQGARATLTKEKRLA